MFVSLIFRPLCCSFFLPLALINASLHAFCTGIVIMHTYPTLALVFQCARLRANNEWRARRLQFIEYAANEVVVNFGGADCRDGTASSEANAAHAMHTQIHAKLCVYAAAQSAVAARIKST
jgi:hypothetical protein